MDFVIWLWIFYLDMESAKYKQFSSYLLNMAVEYGGNYMATMSSICNWNNSLALGKKSDLTL